MDTSDLHTILQQAYERAIKAGYSPDAIKDFFIKGLLEKSTPFPQGKNAILVDDNYDILNTLDEQLKTRLDMNSYFMLIQDIKALPGRFLKRSKEIDLVICGINYIDELKTAVPDLEVETIGFVVKTDFQMARQLVGLPSGSRVGFCCATKESSHSFFKTAPGVSGSFGQHVHAGLDDTPSVEAMFGACDIIFATHYVYPQLVKNFSTTKPIHQVTVKIEPENLDFIISNLQK